MKRIITYLLLIFIISCDKKEIKVELQGVIKTDQNQLLKNAKVTLYHQGISEITSDDGTYNFQNLKPGDYLVCVKVGFDSLSQNTTVYADKTNILDFTLEDTRVKYMGIYKCLRTTTNWKGEILFLDTVNIDVHRCDTAINWIYFDNRLKVFYSNGSFRNDNYLNCDSGKFYPDSLYYWYPNGDCDPYLQYSGKKIDP